MRVVIDAFPLVARSGGVKRYAYEMIRRLATYTEHEFYLHGLMSGVESCRVSGQTLEEATRCLDQMIAANEIPISANMRDWIAPLQKTFVSDWYWKYHQRRSRKTLQRFGLDLYWGTNFFSPTSQNYPSLVTVHDVVHIDCPEYVNPIALRQLTQRAEGQLKQTDRIVTVSQFTKERLMDHYQVAEDRIDVVPNAVDTEFRIINDQQTLEEIRRRYQLPARFLLFVSTLEPRKNVEGLLNGYIESEVWKENVALVLVGARGWKSETIFARLEAYQSTYPIHWVGNVNWKDLPAIYNLADAFVFPTHYEGFGIPIIEAMACGCPVLCSKTTACREVAGDAALLVDPGDHESIATGIRRLMEESEIREQMTDLGIKHVQQYSWEHSADRLVDCMKKTVTT